MEARVLIISCLLMAATVPVHIVSPNLAWSANADDPLEPDKAFRISARTLDKHTVEVRFRIADGYYMYRNRFKFETSAGKLIANVELPRGKAKEDPFFGKTEIYRREIRIRIPVSAAEAARGGLKLKVTSQGCSDQGVCYLPQEQWIGVPLQRVSEAAGNGKRQLGLRERQ